MWLLFHQKKQLPSSLFKSKNKQRIHKQQTNLMQLRDCCRSATADFILPNECGIGCNSCILSTHALVSELQLTFNSSWHQWGNSSHLSLSLPHMKIHFPWIGHHQAAAQTLFCPAVFSVQVVKSSFGSNYSGIQFLCSDWCIVYCHNYLQ